MVDPDSGDVDRETVLAVLRFHKVEVFPDPLEKGYVLMIRDNRVLSLPIDPWVSRKVTDSLKRTFSIPIHHFFRPEMMGDSSSGRAN